MMKKEIPFWKVLDFSINRTAKYSKGKIMEKYLTIYGKIVYFFKVILYNRYEYTLGRNI